MTEETMLRDPTPQQIEPLADRRSQNGGLLLLRRYLCAGTAVLRVSFRGRISCAGTTKVTKAKSRTERVPPHDALQGRGSKARFRRLNRQPSLNDLMTCCPHCPEAVAR
jgi:hypothetical protein